MRSTRHEHCLLCRALIHVHAVPCWAIMMPPLTSTCLHLRSACVASPLLAAFYILNPTPPRALLLTIYCLYYSPLLIPILFSFLRRILSTPTRTLCFTALSSSSSASMFTRRAWRLEDPSGDEGGEGGGVNGTYTVVVAAEYISFLSGLDLKRPFEVMMLP